MMNFEDPSPEIEKSKRSARVMDKRTIEAMEEFAAKKLQYNWEKVGKAMGVTNMDNYYELKRNENAHDIVEMCFARGLPL